MIEDKELNRILKEALEAQGAFAPREKARTRFTPRYWAPPMLLAASLAIVAGFQILLTPSSNSIETAISLLSSADELDFDAKSFSSPEEMLLAWQEAPYQNDEF